ncbi:hypothetical protein [Ottowia sp.]|uniref:hypothetical protein n=1 Tax=Ottowia sp. TaxID=1898956 RepID=UPI003A8942DF
MSCRHHRTNPAWSRTAAAALVLASTATLSSCAVVTTTAAVAGTAVSVTSSVVVTGAQLTGQAVGWGISALAASPEPDDSAIVVRERIDPAPPSTPSASSTSASGTMQ